MGPIGFEPMIFAILNQFNQFVKVPRKKLDVLTNWTTDPYGLFSTNIYK